ncbi:hypothetical protein GE061_001627, partial [Apolygus lucorum]
DKYSSFGNRLINILNNTGSWTKHSRLVPPREERTGRSAGIRRISKFVKLMTHTQYEDGWALCWLGNFDSLEEKVDTPCPGLSRRDIHNLPSVQRCKNLRRR